MPAERRTTDEADESAEERADVRDRQPRSGDARRWDALRAFVAAQGQRRGQVRAEVLEGSLFITKDEELMHRHVLVHSVDRGSAHDYRDTIAVVER